MAVSEAQKRASSKYKQKFDELRFRVTPEQKDKIKEFASSHGLSVSELVNRSVQEFMDKEN